MGCSVFFFKQKTAYEVRISDGSSDVCSSDLEHEALLALRSGRARTGEAEPRRQAAGGGGTAEQMQGAAAGEQILRIGHGMSPRLISAPRSSAPLEFRRRQHGGDGGLSAFSTGHRLAGVAAGTGAERHVEQCGRL